MKRIFKLTADKRTASRNVVLGGVCAFVAGAVNAGGFLYVGRYTSHITGQVAGSADALVLGHYSVFYKACLFVFVFFLGAFLTSLLIQIARVFKLHSQYAFALFLSGLVLIFLGLNSLYNPNFSQFLLWGLFFSMGIQNATVSELSRSEVRATHMTGVITDLGLECGKILFFKSYDLTRFKVLGIIFLSFFCGGISGAYLFANVFGLSTLVLLGAILTGIALFPIYRDIRVRYRLLKRF